MGLVYFYILAFQSRERSGAFLRIAEKTTERASVNLYKGFWLGFFFLKKANFTLRYKKKANFTLRWQIDKTQLTVTRFLCNTI